MINSLSILDFTLKHFHQPRGANTTIYYRRRIPKDLAIYYDTSHIVRSTKASDKAEAIIPMIRIDGVVEQEWKVLRGEFSGNNLDKAKDSLSRNANYDLESDTEYYDGAKSEYIDVQFDKLPPEVTYQIEVQTQNDRNFDRSKAMKEAFKKYLDPHIYRSIEIISSGKVELLASEYVDAYAKLKDLNKVLKPYKDSKKAFDRMLAYLGDLQPHLYKKININAYINSLLASGLSTATVQKNFNLLNAAFNLVNEQYEIDFKHRFSKPNIPHNGDDKKERIDFTSEEIATLKATLKDSTNTTDHIIMIAMDTAMRVSEVVGLAVNDIHLEAETPYLLVRRNIYRPLKTKNSKRTIPLTEYALDAVRSITQSGEWLFPKYLDQASKMFKTTSASNTANNRIRKILNDKSSPTMHCFRHTMQTRLRNVECSLDKRNEICGWSKGISGNYGSPSDIKIKAAYMLSASKL